MAEAADAKRDGHEQYKTWLRSVGACFSPLHACREPLRVGQWTSWSVEGLYQGLKLFSIDDPSLIDPSLEIVWLDAPGRRPVHVPSIMDVRDDLARHPLFRLLKSGRKHNGARNRRFGSTPGTGRNWAWTESWRHPELDHAVDRARFRADVFVPALRAALSQYPEEVVRLQAWWRDGQFVITDEMRLAHGHLAHVEAIVTLPL